MNDEYNDLDEAINDAIFEKEINEKITYNEIYFLKISNITFLVFNYTSIFHYYKKEFLENFFIYLYNKKKINYILIKQTYGDISGVHEKFDLCTISSSGKFNKIKRNLNNINNINSIIRTYKLKEIANE
jgi:hypothetical protein